MCHSVSLWVAILFSFLSSLMGIKTLATEYLLIIVGLFNVEGLQVYDVSLWIFGKNDLALSAARNLPTCLPTIKMSSATAVICLICTLLYSISGAGTAIDSILKMPSELLQSAKVSFVVSAIDAIDQTNQLQTVVSSSRGSLSSLEEMVEIHLLIALSKLIRNGSGSYLSIRSGIDHLIKVVHTYSYNSSLGNMLGYLLLSREQWDNNHVVRNCCSVGCTDSIKQEFRSAREVLGAETVACDATACCKMEYSLSTCKYQRSPEPSVLGIMQRLQRLYHRVQGIMELMVGCLQFVLWINFSTSTGLSACRGISCRSLFISCIRGLLFSLLWYCLHGTCKMTK